MTKILNPKSIAALGFATAGGTFLMLYPDNNAKKIPPMVQFGSFTQHRLPIIPNMPLITDNVKKIRENKEYATHTQKHCAVMGIAKIKYLTLKGYFDNEVELCVTFKNTKEGKNALKKVITNANLFTDPSVQNETTSHARFFLDEKTHPQTEMKILCARLIGSATSSDTVVLFNNLLDFLDKEIDPIAQTDKDRILEDAYKNYLVCNNRFKYQSNPKTLGEQVRQNTITYLDEILKEMDNAHIRHNYTQKSVKEGMTLIKERSEFFMNNYKDINVRLKAFVHQPTPFEKAVNFVKNRR